MTQKYEFKNIKDVDLSKLDDGKCYYAGRGGIGEDVNAYEYFNGKWLKDNLEKFTSVILPYSPTKTGYIRRAEVRQFVDEWMGGHESDTFVKNKEGLYWYTCEGGWSSLNLKVLFEHLIEDFIGPWQSEHLKIKDHSDGDYSYLCGKKYCKCSD